MRSILHDDNLFYCVEFGVDVSAWPTTKVCLVGDGPTRQNIPTSNIRGVNRMSSNKINDSIQVALAELHEERARIDHAIAELETLLEGLGEAGMPSKRRSRPFDHQRHLAREKSPRSRAGWTAEARRAAADRMRNYWASRKGEDSSETSDGSEMHGTQRRRAMRKGSRKRSTKGWTPEARRAAAERMKQYWTSRRDEGSEQNSAHDAKIP
jgi:hypothetical protein